jgi:hypothetical protein
VSGKSANGIVLKKYSSLLLAAHVCLLICYSGDPSVQYTIMSEPADILPNDGPPATAAATGSNVFSVKLSPFWPQAPVAWFAQAECIFHTKRVTDSFDKYCHLMASLPPESVCLVMDIVEVPPAVNPYETLKERLLSQLQLSEYERLDQLFTMPGLGSRKLLAMLAAMLELCPRGEENTRTFAGLFLHRLPRELRILLAHEDLRDLKLSAARADVLHTHHRGGGAVNAEDNTEVYPEVNAVAGGTGRLGHNCGRGGAKGGGGRGQKGDKRPPVESAASRQAREAVGPLPLPLAIRAAGFRLQAACDLHLAGKRAGRGQLNAVAAGHLLHLFDEVSRRRFLVDTGAAYSVFPHKSARESSGPQLTGAGGKPIHYWGERELNLSSYGRRFSWTFLLADVQLPILGADFLRQHHLVVDLAAGQLLDTSTMDRFGPAVTVGGGSLFARVQATPTEFRDLFSEYQDVANTSGHIPASKHGVEHVLETVGRPVMAKFRPLGQEKLQAAKAEFLQMEQDGIIRRSRSSWASPLHMVRKANGSWRPCGDYRQLNLATVADKYPVPNMQDLSARLHGRAIFSKLDLRKGYYQIPMRPEDVAKTAVITPFGLWEFLWMPFGLKNAGLTFQRLMDRLGADLDFVFIYLDDILVASPDVETHKQHLHTVLQRLRQFGLVLNLEKCELGLGHRPPYHGGGSGATAETCRRHPRLWPPNGHAVPTVFPGVG